MYAKEGQRVGPCPTRYKICYRATGIKQCDISTGTGQDNWITEQHPDEDSILDQGRKNKPFSDRFEKNQIFM